MTRIDWSLPYSSQREGVFARNVVATSQPLAAQAGLEILRAGGTAVDAAVATAACMTVIEPTSNGIGSDAFALVWAGGGLHGLNASGRAPAALKPEDYATGEIRRLGWDGVTVPGAVSAWVTLSERFGALPFERLLEPAIRLARAGFPVARQTAGYWRRGVRTYADFAPWQATFAPQGRGPEPGDVVTLPDHARTLEAIASSGGGAFYEGDLAAAIADHAAATGGLITREDMAAHRADWVRPISMEYRGLTLHEIPPNGQGLVALIALGMLKELDGRLDVAAMPIDSADWLHVQIEAMKLAFADGHRFIADPDHMDATVEALLDPRYLAERAAMIDPSRALDPKHGMPKRGGTIYLTAADADGTMISYIQSNYAGFGSGVVVPGTGISLQNRGCCFTLEEGHPNRAGGGKRPYHTIIPGFVTRGDEPVMSFGVMGGYMQPQGHAQVMVRLADHGQNPQAALDAPRWQVFEGRRVGVETGFVPEVYEDLRARGHEVEIVEHKTVVYGGGQCILRRPGGVYFGASDMRRDGQAVGF